MCFGKTATILTNNSEEYKPMKKTRYHFFKQIAYGVHGDPIQAAVRHVEVGLKQEDAPAQILLYFQEEINAAD